MRDNVEQPTGIRKTYPQAWKAYNAAQTHEKEQFLKLLHDLCSGVEEPEPKKTGRPRMPIQDALFTVCFKIYSTVSGRRFMTDLREAQADGFIGRTPHFNSIFNYLENPKLTPILHAMIRETSLPLKAIEQDFAVDSSGFTTSPIMRWMDYKYSRLQLREKQGWVKVHLMCGVRTNIVTSVEIAAMYANDGPLLPDLVEATAQNFQIREVSADKAYVSGHNYQFVEQLGATAFIPFKTNNKDGTGAWGKMFHYFKFRREEFMRHYHKRSNVETVFSMIKRKFGQNVRSKGEIAQVNECLCKIICHNICCLIQESHELGIDIEFGSN